jgi:hypothetical protein
MFDYFEAARSAKDEVVTRRYEEEQERLAEPTPPVSEQDLAMELFGRRTSEWQDQVGDSLRSSIENQRLRKRGQKGRFGK